MLARRPPDAAVAVPPPARLVDSNNNPLREEDVRALAADGLGGAGAFVTLLRFFPNFFFPRELFLLFMVLIMKNENREEDQIKISRSTLARAWEKSLFVVSVPETRRIVRRQKELEGLRRGGLFHTGTLFTDTLNPL